MELQQLKGFCAVAKHGNFTTAAQKTFRSQPTVSLQVKALEDELGVKLFERIGTKHVLLTREGETLYKLVTPLLSEFDLLGAQFTEALGAVPAREVRLVTTDSIMVHLLPPVLKKFKKQFPHCQIVIKNSDSPDEIARLVVENEVEIGIGSTGAKTKNIDCEIISRSERVLVAPRDHPLARKANISLRDIAAYPLILPTSGSNTRRSVDRIFAERNLPITVTMEVVGRQAIKTYVSLGLGISIINERYLNKDDRAQLFVKRISSLFGQSEAAVLTRHGRKLSAPAQMIKDLIIESAAGSEH